MTYASRHAVGKRPEPATFTHQDKRLAMEIAEFVADRAQSFTDYECRAWALTDFGVWAVLAGESPRLSMEEMREKILH